MPLPADMTERAAYFSPCGRYRYWLRRDLDLLNPIPLLSVLMNPSKAGAETGDPTTTVLCRNALRQGFGIHAAVNMKACIETDSTRLTDDPEEIGPLNDDAIRMALEWCDRLGGRVLTAWGTNARLGARVGEVLELLRGRPLLRFGVTSDGGPRFPRALPRDIKLEEWQA